MGSGTLLAEAVNLMLLGMGTVFVFLTVLVFVTRAMSALVKKFTLDPPVGEIATAVAPAEDSTLLAVIAAAIHVHRSRH